MYEEEQHTIFVGMYPQHSKQCGNSLIRLFSYQLQVTDRRIPRDPETGYPIMAINNMINDIENETKTLYIMESLLEEIPEVNSLLVPASI